MPSSGTEFTSASLLCFILLGIIRGTFSVVIHFAVRSYKSPSLVFLLRTPGTVVLYIVLLVFWSVRSDEMKRMFLNNFKNVRCYWKLAVMGLVQLAAPYMLFMRGLKVLNPTVGGVFMAAAPWTTILLERLPFIRIKTALNGSKILALCLGFIGVILVSIGNVAFSLQHQSDNCYVVAVNASNVSSFTTPDSSGQRKVCDYFTVLDAAVSLFSLIGGCFMWSVSSVFWRSYKGDMHYVTSGVWNNVFGGVYATVIWAAFQQYEKSDEVDWNNGVGVSSVVFLSVISGWLAAVMVDYLYKAVGPAATNRVLCLVPLVTWLEDWLLVRKPQKMYGDAVAENIVEVLDESYLNILIGFYCCAGLMFRYSRMHLTANVGIVLVFVGLVLSSIEPGITINPLQQPLLDSNRDKMDSDREHLRESVRELEDGAYSEEEVVNGRSRETEEEHGYQFPPLVEYKPNESSHD